ncbi:gluconokinase [Azospirillum argentinense]|uniref:gluconokinase n=1 Tax=Azospirillum argentinense TaxID=2970906 RepID=UPI0031F30D03
MDAIVVMGVAGCGKTSVGEELARRLGWQFLEGDGFHPPENIAKMSAGIPLQDEDRWGWLDTIAAHIVLAKEAKAPVVVSCSG